MVPILNHAVVAAVGGVVVASVVASAVCGLIVSADVIAGQIVVGGVKLVAEVAGAGIVGRDGDEVLGSVTDLAGNNVVVPSGNQAAGIREAVARGHVLSRDADAGPNGG